jgi:hypothetical protein
MPADCKILLRFSQVFKFSILQILDSVHDKSPGVSLNGAREMGNESEPKGKEIKSP